MGMDEKSNARLYVRRGLSYPVVASANARTDANSICLSQVIGLPHNALHLNIFLKVIAYIITYAHCIDNWSSTFLHNRCEMQLRSWFL